VKLSAIEHIFFDLDHTLWDYDRNSNETLNLLYNQFSLEALGLFPKSRFIESFHRANLKVWDIFDENRLNRKELRNKRMELVFEEFNLNSEVPQGFHDAYYLNCSSGAHLIEGAKEILEWLADKYSLHIITNGFEDAQHTKLISSGISGFFKTVTTSEIALSKKPDPEYFHFALNKAGAEVMNSLVIGDGLRTDIAGSIKAGVKVIWFNPEEKENPYPFVPMISSLFEIKKHLKPG